MLHTLGFQLTVEHPYSRVITLLKKIVGLRRDTEGGEGGDNKTLSRQLYQVCMMCMRACPTGLPGRGSVLAVVWVLFIWLKRF